MDNNERLNIYERSHQGFRDVVYQLADIAGIVHSNGAAIGYIISLLDSALINAIVIEPGDHVKRSGWQKPYTRAKYNKKLEIIENASRYMQMTQKLFSDDAMRYAILNEILRKRYPVKTREELEERYFLISNDLDRLRRDMEPIASALNFIAKMARKTTHKGREPEWNEYKIVWEAAEFFDDASCHKPSSAKTSPFTKFVQKIFEFAFTTKDIPDKSRIIRAALKERRYANREFSWNSAPPAASVRSPAWTPPTNGVRPCIHLPKSSPTASMTPAVLSASGDRRSTS